MPAEKPDEPTKLLRALLMLAIEERSARSEPPGAPKIELLLDAAGFDSSEIAALTGKQAGSVRMALSRARKSAVKPTEETSDG